VKLEFIEIAISIFERLRQTFEDTRIREYSIRLGIGIFGIVGVPWSHLIAEDS
jgi:hypothetical protein